MAVDQIREKVNREEAQRLAERMAADAVTLLDNDGCVLPLHTEKATHILVLIISNNTDPAEGEHFAEVLAEKGLQHEILRWNDDYSAAVLERVAQRLPDCDLILLAIYLTIGAWKGPMRLPGAMPQLLQRISSHLKPVVAISFGDPYVFADLPPLSARLCSYGGGRLMERTVARALTGETEIRGRLPVSISERYPFGAGLIFRP